jgi:uncharacterized surface protein with fasciclin (FAS1) repeats
MNKNINKSIRTGVLVFAGLLVSYACSDTWDEHYDANLATGNVVDATIYQQLKTEGLTDFVEILDATGYNALLDESQLVTVFAPVNGSFNKDSLLTEIKNGHKDLVITRFVKNHIARYNFSNNTNKQDVMLLNQKKTTMLNGVVGVDSVHMKKDNTVCNNGILHIMNSELPFHPNIYELLETDPDIDSMYTIIRYYDDDSLDVNRSVYRGVDGDGNRIYVDSVMIKANRLLQRLDSYIYREDSNYLVIAPRKEAYNERYNLVKDYFNFNIHEDDRDSLQQYYTIRALLDDAVFSLTNQQAPNDSLLSVQYLYERPNYSSPKPVYHVFKKPFEAGGILNGAERVECSNGTLFKVAQWPLQPEKTFFRQIWVEGEQTAYITEYNKCTYNTRQLSADSISDGAYLRILPTDGTANWEMTYRINNTLSGDYDICAVILPKSVYNQTNPDMRPCKFKATLNYVDEQGNAQSYACKNSDGKTEFTTDPSRIDTVVVAEWFHFPACNYGQTEIKVSLKLTCSITSRQTSSYAREMFLDCIYLRPRKNIEN